jgi:hypothetical protein
MNRTRWMIALGVLVTLVVLGTDLALEKAFSSYHSQSGAAVREPVKASEAAAAPLTVEPVDMPAAADSGQEYDRSDLLLSQG